MARKRDSAKGAEGDDMVDTDIVDAEPENDTAIDEGVFENAPPTGMTRRNANDNVGWVAKFAGHVVYGILLGRFTRSDRDEQGNVRSFYQLKLLRPCKVALSAEEKTEENTTKDAKKGDVVNLDENKGVEGLKDALAEGGTQVAWIKFVGKKRQQKDRRKTFWDVETYTQKRNAPF